MPSPDSNSDHSRFEELCALEAGGELTVAERQDLTAHLAVCGSCRELHADFVRICSMELPLVAVVRHTERGDEGAEAEEIASSYDRFRRRLAREQNPVQAPARSRRIWLLIPAAVSLAVAAFLVARVQVENARSVAAAERTRRLELERLQTEVQSAAKGQQDLARVLAGSQAQRTELERTLARVQADYAALHDAERGLHLSLEAAMRRNQELERSLESARSQSAELGRAQKDTENRLQLSMAEVRRLRTAQAEAAEQASEQRNLVASLRRRLEMSENSLAHAASERSAEMQAADLFSARDLHIVDVYDVDSKGNTRRTFGRVYYIEKKLLLFYAFDLQEKRREHQTAVFQAWGYREAAPQRPQSLGLFQADSQVLNRWVLKVNNPKVLERVDIVFVTLEPRLGRTTPSGHRLLYANLTGPPNHP